MAIAVFGVLTPAAGQHRQINLGGANDYAQAWFALLPLSVKMGTRIVFTGKDGHLFSHLISMESG